MNEINASLKPQPDEMSFEQSIEHVTQTMYWDAVDGVWCSISMASRERWDAFANQLRAAHEREVGVLRAENVKRRELARDLERARHALCFDALYECDECAAYPICDAKLAKPMQELGIEVE